MNTGEPPLVSVVVPVRNEDAAVGHAIESVLAQTWQDLEVLVVDGASTDSTAAVVEGYAVQDPRVRLLHNPRRIIPTALNTGLQAARGQYLLRVDAHWTVNPSYAETALAVLEAHPEAAAVGGRRNGAFRTRTGQAVTLALSSRFGVGNSLYHYGTQAQETDHASGGMYRVEVLRELGGWDEQLLVNEDVDLDHRVLGLGHRIRFEPSMVAGWRVRESLRDLGRQYRRYGRGKAHMVRKNGRSAVRARHLAAPALVLSVPVSAAAAATGRRRLAALVAAPYPLALAAVSTRTARSQPEPQPAPHLLAGAFAVMHLGWGLGFLEGLLAGTSPAASSGGLTHRGG